MSESENRKLADLRVIDLRVELEKRGLDRNGVKQVLMQRLKEALEEEGHDPETYTFDSTDTKKRRSSIAQNEDSEDKAEETTEEEVKKAENKTAEKVNNKENGEKKEVKGEIKNETKEKTADDKTVKNEEDIKDAKNNKEDVKDQEPKEKVENSPEEEKTEKEEKLKILQDIQVKKPSSIEEDEDPIRLTLDDDETLHDVENETADKNRDAEAPSDKKKNEDTESKNEASVPEKERNGEEYRRSGEKLQKKVGGKSNPNVVWVSNVAQNTRASELKAALSACGKVTGAKVVVNARYPGSNCFGYVTMGSLEDVESVIAKLNNTELNGQIIKIEKFDQVRADQMRQMKDAKSSTSSKPKKDEKSDGEKKDEVKAGEKDEEKKEGEKKPVEVTEGEKDKERTKSKDRKSSKDRKTDKKDRSKHDDKGRERGRRSRSPRFSGKGRGVLTFAQIKEERDRQKLREKERILREESRRRVEEGLRQREIERRQRQEALRLEREREKLRIEKEKIDREKAELIRMERERARLEREKIAREKLELERTLIRLEEDRRAVKRSAPYRSDDRYEDRKRPAPSERHFDAPPPPRFEPPQGKGRETSPKTRALGSSKDYSKSRPPHDSSYPDKRGRDYDGSISRSTSGPNSSGKYDRPFESRDIRNEPRARDGPPPQRTGKDSRYLDRERERNSPHGFQRGSIRDDRRGIDTKSTMPLSSRDHRYDSPNEPPRFDSRNSSSWSSSTAKFSVTSTSKPWEKDEWRQPSSNDRWPVNTTTSGTRPYPSGSGLSIAAICPPPPPGINTYSDSRFEYGKSLGSSLRKY